MTGTDGVSPDPHHTEGSAGRPTLETIAHEASVSVATVSKVLNDRKGIAPETRERVVLALRANGYRKRGSQATFSPQIELVFGSLGGEWAIELIRGAVRVAGDNGLSVVVSESGVPHGVAPGWARLVARRQPAGVILVSSDLSADDKAELRSHNVPFVIVDPTGDPAPDVPSVGSTNWAGGVAATRHLIDLGHTRIGVVAGPDDLMVTRARLAGFRSAMEAASLPIDEDLIFSDELSEENNPVAGVSLLSRADRPTAIFAASDVKALGVYEAARIVGLSVPEDVSVVGYDDLAVARWAGPPLTTVRQQLMEMAQEAAKMVLSLRSAPGSTADRIELATSLVIRGSTRRLDRG